MRALVLIFVFVGFGMIVAASMTGTAALGWVSVAASVVAASALSIDWRRRRTAIGDRIGPPAPGHSPTVEYPATAVQVNPWQQEPAPAELVERSTAISDAEQECAAEFVTAQSPAEAEADTAATAEAGVDTADPTPVVKPVPPAVAPAAAKLPASFAQPAPEPGEESAAAAAVAIVAKLDDEVRVVDEQPRYHLADCHALVGQKSIPMPAKEAVESEFTPCEMCTPVRVLVSAGSAAGEAPE